MEKYFNYLFETFLSDIEVYNQVWLWACLLIPAFFFTIFLFVKFIILTMPIWIPLHLLFSLANNVVLKVRVKNLQDRIEIGYKWDEATKKELYQLREDTERQRATINNLYRQIKEAMDLEQDLDRNLREARKKIEQLEKL